MLGDSPDDYPRGYAARFSSTAIDPAAPSVPVLVSGNGVAATDTVLKLPTKATARYALISQTGSAQGHWWSIAEIQAECAD
jgi:hypothetical protein